MNTINPSMEQTTQSAMQFYQEIGTLARESLDVALKSIAALTKGLDETARSANGIAQENFARVVTASKTLAGARTPRELMDLHTEFTKDCSDFWMEGASRLSQIVARVTKDAMDPMTQHANNAFSKILQKTTLNKAA